MTSSIVLAAERSGLLGSSLPYENASLRPMPRLLHLALGRGIAAITLRRRIFVAPDRFDALMHGEEGILLAHELIHVAQWRRDGVVRFLVTYLRDYSRLRLLGLRHDVAYRHIGYEWAAYAGSRHIVRAR